MNVKKLVRGLTYLGAVTGKKQTYHVFKGAGFFLVLFGLGVLTASAARR